MQPTDSIDRHAEEVRSGNRFAFGANWALFLETLDEDCILRAEDSLKSMLERDSLEGLSFLDAGCGSGLFSLAARRLGARVHSFDYDPRSTACAGELKRRWFHDDPHWTVETGSVLDKDYLRRLGRFDVVYSWGVLHHTGAMWEALANVADSVAPGGLLFIAIYNDQGRATRVWKAVKHAYNRLPRGLKWLVLWPAFLRLWGPTFLRDSLKGRPRATWSSYSHAGRGMSPWRDVVDWVGGYPFEVARPDEVFDFYRARGFTLKRLKTMAGGLGCNEYVFERSS
jgi:2-polyprenyl-6-hydroxyphenyl methylase/3-demethylubiquinone-9 3-methyltransferase